MRALIAPRHLMRPPRLRKFSDINVLDVSARHRKRYFVFRFASGRAGVTTDATRVVNNFCPLNLPGGGMDGEFSHGFAPHLNLTPYPAPTHFSTERRLKVKSGHFTIVKKEGSGGFVRSPPPFDSDQDQFASLLNAFHGHYSRACDRAGCSNAGYSSADYSNARYLHDDCSSGHCSDAVSSNEPTVFAAGVANAGAAPDELCYERR
jgi:hypothetical protein